MIPASWPCLITAVVIAEVGRAGRLQSWLNWRWLQFLGLISYSLYLVHNPLTGAAYNVGYRLLGRSPYAQLACFFFMLTMNIGAAGVFWYLFERPSMWIAQRIKHGEKVRPQRSPAVRSPMIMGPAYRAGRA